MLESLYILDDFFASLEENLSIVVAPSIWRKLQATTFYRTIAQKWLRL